MVFKSKCTLILNRCICRESTVLPSFVQVNFIFKKKIDKISKSLIKNFNINYMIYLFIKLIFIEKNILNLKTITLVIKYEINMKKFYLI